MASGGKHKISPRKFSEKIALLNKKEAEGNVQFEAIIKEVQATRSLGSSTAPVHGAGGAGKQSSVLTEADNEELEEVYWSLVQSVKGSDQKIGQQQDRQSIYPSAQHQLGPGGDGSSSQLAQFHTNECQLANPYINKQLTFDRSSRCVDPSNPVDHQHQETKLGCINQPNEFLYASVTTKRQPDMPYVQEANQISSYRSRGTSFGSSTADSIQQVKYNLCTTTDDSINPQQQVIQDHMINSHWQIQGEQVISQQTSDNMGLLGPQSDKHYWQKSSSDPALHHVMQNSPCSNSINLQQQQIVNNQLISNQMISNSESILLISNQVQHQGATLNQHSSYSPSELEQENVGPTESQTCCANYQQLQHNENPSLQEPPQQYDSNVPGIKIYAIDEEIQQLKQDLKSQVLCCDQQETSTRESSLPNLANLQFTSDYVDEQQNFVRPLEATEKWTSQCNNINSGSGDISTAQDWPTAPHLLSSSDCGLTGSNDERCSSTFPCDMNNNSMARSYSHNCIDYLSKQQISRATVMQQQPIADCLDEYRIHESLNQSHLRPNHWFEGPLAFAGGGGFTSGDRFAGCGSGTSLRAQLGSISPLNSPQSNLTSPQSEQNSPASIDYNAAIADNPQYLLSHHQQRQQKMVFKQNQPMLATSQQNLNRQTVIVNQQAVQQEVVGIGAFGPSQSPSSSRRLHNKACRGSYSVTTNQQASTHRPNSSCGEDCSSKQSNNNNNES